MPISRGMDQEDVTCACARVHTHTHTHEYYSAIKKNEIRPSAATWMDAETVKLSEVSQTEEEKYHVASLICGIYEEMIQMSLNKTERDSQT